jgi:hypothetical protein
LDFIREPSDTDILTPVKGSFVFASITFPVTWENKEVETEQSIITSIRLVMS